MKEGWNMRVGIKDRIIMFWDGREVTFGEKVHTTKGLLFVARFKKRKRNKNTMQ